MSSHCRHEKSKEHQGGATTPKALDSPFQVRTSVGRENETDGAAASKGNQVQLGR